MPPCLIQSAARLPRTENYGTYVVLTERALTRARVDFYVWRHVTIRVGRRPHFFFGSTILCFPTSPPFSDNVNPTAYNISERRCKRSANVIAPLSAKLCEIWEAFLIPKFQSPLTSKMTVPQLLGKFVRVPENWVSTKCYRKHEY